MQATKRTNNATQPRASRRFELSLLEPVTCRRRPMFLAAYGSAQKLRCYLSPCAKMPNVRRSHQAYNSLTSLSNERR